MKNLKLLTLCFITTIGFAQKTELKTSQSAKVNKDVVVELNTNYVEIEIDTWNKDEVEIEAYLESDKLSQDELKKALKSWNLNFDATTDKVVISSNGSRGRGLFPSDNYDDFLKDLEFDLADIPEIPSLKGFPEIPNLANMPKLPSLPEMPEFPELPELPEGVKSITFDYDKYQEEGEKYLSEWSKKYEKQGGKELQKNMEAWARKFAESGYEEKMKKWGEDYGKKFEGKWAKDMEKWGEKFGKNFGKDMEKWGEEFGERFGEDWAKKMEAWGERFGREMEKQAEAMESQREALESQREAIRDKRKGIEKQRKAAILESREARARELEARRDAINNRREAILINRGSNTADTRVKRVIKIKMPKKAKLKLNVRHGELKIATAVHNAKGDLSYTDLLAQNIDGSDTSINVSYSKVLVNDWRNGTLSLKYVDNAVLKSVQSLTINSNSSNIGIDNLSGNNIIDGSFGELTISNILDTFNNLNIVLENSDAWVKLPNVDYSLMFRGERSKYNNEVIKTKTVNGTSGKSIIINAKYSTVNTN
ncbi:hypothetical protein ACFQ1Q_12715 [Winogradskyella litorisediminis]|uniref:Adhesin domain-containing protein n=1 Tax=Winogradskyella litorisediminis TaxID=1156618 RepID=A0ABW3N8Y9_9FLAO